MGVYIKGMEMPKSCLNCFLSRSGCRAVLKRMRAMEAGTWIPANYRHDDCPLVPVPKHGRLIDADELLALVYANIALFDSTPGRLGADQKLVRAWLESMADDINDAPTIISAEEVET